MANKKDPDGVQATIERLTGQKPCPKYLRTMLNKYLYEPELFSGAKKGKGKTKVLGKLKASETDILVHNLLLLDPVFLGNTATVVAVVNNGNEAKTADEELVRSAKTMQQRLDIYTYWSEHLQSLRDILKNDSIDLRTVRLDSKLSAIKAKDTAANQPAFFLGAVHQLEQSEQRGRVSLPSVGELMGRADAYLALGDYSNADANAYKALEQDEKNSRAWFVRVMAALKQSNHFHREMSRHTYESVEMAEPMSAHERQAREMADEAGGNAQTHLQKLRAILPKALLFWPKNNFGTFDHRAQYMFVRDLFISQLFGVICVESRTPSYVEMQWPSTHLNPSYVAHLHASRGLDALSESEIEVLTRLFTERDKAGALFFTLGDPKSIQLDLKLLHVRSVVSPQSCGKHWKEFMNASFTLTPTWFEKAIFRDENLALIWQEQCAKNEGEDQVNSFLLNFQLKLDDRRKEKTLRLRLNQNGMQFDRLFRSDNFQACLSLSRLTQEIFTQTGSNPLDICGTLIYPLSGSIAIPVGRLLYWKYLEVISIIKLSASSFQLDTEALTILANAESLSLEFTQERECFWTESEEYEDGGGEDRSTAPFGIDLRDTMPWMQAIESVLKSLTADPPHELLGSVLDKLRVFERPYAPRDFDAFAQELHVFSNIDGNN